MSSTTPAVSPRPQPASVLNHSRCVPCPFSFLSRSGAFFQLAVEAGSEVPEPCVCMSVPTAVSVLTLSSSASLDNVCLCLSHPFSPTPHPLSRSYPLRWYGQWVGGWGGMYRIWVGPDQRDDEVCV